ncbi:hypothetical protein AAV99_09245 [Aurantiacibacter marinus]|uniref:Fe-S cluster protein n=2 Tax=Aurantiacibacter marinus TaxID=874156 RepID=A0A0H0XNB6_9SPHN|nr:hypothetical protein AAV99_09245 [Aurantiacibacter marinus]
MLGAAMELAIHPRIYTAVIHGSARSEVCGSSLDLDIELDPQDHIERLGLRVRACAVGQAAAAVFARHAKGKSGAQIENSYNALVAWLSSDGPAPDWPDIGLIEPARAYQGRHGAILLPWRAAMAALFSVAASG